MKNRAKCKLCHDVIESFHSTDLVYCKCGEIGVDGGSKLLCFANDFDNFLRVDENGSEIIMTTKNTQDHVVANKEQRAQPSKEELLNMLDMMVENYTNLPPQAMTTPVTHYDLSSALLLISSILRSP
jgi:hypothetical protein